MELQVSVKRIKKITKERIMLEVSNKSDYDKLEVEVNTNEQSKNKFVIKT